MMMQGHEGPPAPWWRSARYHHRDDLPPPPKPNGSNSLSLILRICALILALSSAIVMASSECTPAGGSGVVTDFSFTRFGAFKLLFGCNIVATMLKAMAIYLQLRLDVAAAAAPDPDDKTVDEDEEEGIGRAGIMLVVMDQLVTPLLYSAMAAAYAGPALSNDQIAACAPFAGQVGTAKILSLAACAAITLAAVAKAVPLPFNLPPVL